VTDQAYYLSEEDRRKVDELLNWYNRQGLPGLRSPSDGVEREELPAPEVYVARIPEWGLPEAAIGGSGEFKPGCAECFIYRVLVIDDPVGTGTDYWLELNNEPPFCDTELYQVGEHAKLVYNFGMGPIASRSWVLVHRDKYGMWHCGTPPVIELVRLTEDSDAYGVISYIRLYSESPIGGGWQDGREVRVVGPG
jgi:hypothetical protein